MLLDRQDVALFFRLQRTLMFYVNERLKIITNELEARRTTSPASRRKTG